MLKKSEFKVSKIKKETDDVVTIFLSGEKFAFTAGQYVTVYLDQNPNSHGKFYTLSNALHEEPISISVKKIGSFSSALHDLKEGNSIYLEGPHGWFYPKEEAETAVFLAAGIGITPFLSVIKDYAKKGIKKNINLFYSNKTIEETCFQNELNNLVQNNDWLTIDYFLTESGLRLNADYIKQKLKNLNNRNFYICGSVSFVVDMRRDLLKHQVKEENIFTESFF